MSPYYRQYLPPIAPHALCKMIAMTSAEKADRKSADLFVLTAQIGVVPPKKTLPGGQYELLTGLRYQLFDYGTLSGDVLINNRRISESHFQANTVFSDLKWKRDAWKAQFGLRWTSLDNSTVGSNLYNELVPNWSLSRDYILATNTMLTASYGGSWYITESRSTSSFIRDDFNDRVSNALGLSLLQRLSPDLYLQPSARMNYSIYTDDLNGDREDTTYSLGLTLIYIRRHRCDSSPIIKSVCPMASRSWIIKMWIWGRASHSA